MVQVSQRQELQDYDRSLLARAYRTLYRRVPPPPTVPPELLDDLDTLLGLDRQLDGLITARATEPQAWREPLIRVQEVLNRPEEPVSSVNLFSE